MPEKTEKEPSAAVAKKPAEDETRKKKLEAAASKEDASSEEETDESEDEEESDGEDEGESDSDEGDEEDSDEEEAAASPGERDASTKGVAKALGVDADEESEEDAEAAEAKPNRAQRRREEAVRRRAAREGKGQKEGGEKAVSAKTASATDDAEKLPKDKNARAKELLRRRQESASGKRVSKLDAGEMVQDSLARAGSATATWIRDHLGLLAGVLIVGVGGAVGYTVWSNHKESVAAAASDQLAKGLTASQGYISPKADTRSDEEKKADPLPVYTTLDARADAELTAYKVVVDKHAGTGPAILAKLGEATAYLDKAQWDDAISSYNAVLGSPLSAADADVKARATEGLGLAKEGKADLDGALSSFKDLEAIKGFEDLGKYHQARMLLKKGSTDEAKEMLIALQKKLEVPTLEGTESSYIKDGVDDYLKRIDPTLVKKKAPTLGGLRGDTLTPEDLKDLDSVKMRKLKEILERQQREGGGHGVPMPGEHP